MVESLAALTTAAREYDLIGLEDKLEYYLCVVIGQKGSFQNLFLKLHIKFKSDDLNFL